MSAERHFSEEFGSIQLLVTYPEGRYAQLAELGIHTGHEKFAQLTQSAIGLLEESLFYQAQGLSLVGLERVHADILDRVLSGDPDRLAFDDFFPPEEKGRLRNYFTPEVGQGQSEFTRRLRTIALVTTAPIEHKMKRLSKIAGVETNQELIDRSLHLFETIVFHQAHDKTVYALCQQDMDAFSQVQDSTGELILLPSQYDPTQHEAIEEYFGQKIPRVDRGGDTKEPLAASSYMDLVDYSFG